MKFIGKIWERFKQMRRRNKIIFIVIFLFILFLIFRSRPKSAVLAYQTVSENNISSAVSASGILDGKKNVSLKFPVAGQLTYLGVSAGDIVRAGQVIAKIDSTALNAAYEEALNTRRNTQAAVDAEHDADKNYGSAETYVQKATRTAAEVANDNAWEAVLAAQQALNDDTNVYSPISGIIVAQDAIAVSQNITPTSLIAQVVDFSQKDFDATVDESDIGGVAVGQDVQVTLNAYGDTVFNGKVVEIEPETQTDSTGAVTVTVKIEVDDPRIGQIYGLNGNADIITASKSNVLTINQDDLIDDSHVYVKSGKSVEKRTIQTGIKSDTDVEVVSGLNAGDQVVTNPADVKL